MNLGLSLSGTSQVSSIEQGFFILQVIPDNFQGSVEVANDNLIVGFGLPEEAQVLSDSNPENVSKLPDQWPHLQNGFAKKSSLSTGLLWPVSDDEGGKLEPRVIINLVLMNGQIKSVGREYRVVDSGRNVGAAFFSIPIELQREEVVELFGKRYVLNGNLETSSWALVHNNLNLNLD